ncbi:hypothetical protein Dimus_031202 [Dionaea muscipula]
MKDLLKFHLCNQHHRRRRHHQTSQRQISPPSSLRVSVISLSVIKLRFLSVCNNGVPVSASVALSSSSRSKTNSFAAAFSVSDFLPPPSFNEGGGGENSASELDDLAADGAVYQKTLRLVECSMFAAVSGLAYLLSSSLAIENYFGCFFSLPIVISSIRWGVAAGRKTMVATTVLLFVLSGPVKALTYLLMHGFVGLTMGSLWRLRVNWSLSLFLSTLVRATGAIGYVLISSFLIRENILALITINVHAAVTLIFNSIGFNSVPSMSAIYALFGTLLLLNCGFFVFLLHILYAVFLTRLGMKTSLSLPRWLENAL